MLRLVQTRVVSSVVGATARFASTTVFTKGHEYARVDGKIATCGVTDYAQKQLGDVVFVSLPNVGDKFTKGDTMASVESVKAASDVYAPLSGTIKEINKNLTSNTALVNESAEDKAWFVKIEVSKPEEVKELMDAAAYKKFAESEHH